MAKIVLRFRAADRRIFDAVRSGAKTIETRAATVRFAGIKPGDELILLCQTERFVKPIRQVRYFRSVEEMIVEIPYRKIMPWAASPEELTATYASFPSYQDKIREFGIIALS